MSISNIPCDGAATVAEPAPERCSYWHLITRRTWVGAECVYLEGGRPGLLPVDRLVYMKQDGSVYDGDKFDIEKFTFVKSRGEGRSIICNTVNWCRSCRCFHQVDDSGKPDERLRDMMYGRGNFAEQSQSLFNDYKDNRGWRHKLCWRCEKDTSRGYVYVASTNGAVKIGVSKSSPEKRIKSLQTGCPWPVALHWSVQCDDMYAIESMAHSRLRRHRMSGEWFSVEPDKAVAAVLRVSRQV